MEIKICPHCKEEQEKLSERMSDFVHQFDGQG